MTLRPERVKGSVLWLDAGVQTPSRNSRRRRSLSRCRTTRRFLTSPQLRIGASLRYATASSEKPWRFVGGRSPYGRSSPSARRRPGFTSRAWATRSWSLVVKKKASKGGKFFRKSKCGSEVEPLEVLANPASPDAGQQALRARPRANSHRDHRPPLKDDAGARLAGQNLLTEMGRHVKLQSYTDCNFAQDPTGFMKSSHPTRSS